MEMKAICLVSFVLVLCGFAYPVEINFRHERQRQDISDSKTIPESCKTALNKETKSKIKRHPVS